MKISGVILMAILGSSATAGASAQLNSSSDYFYTIQTNQDMTEWELANQCSQDLDQAKQKLSLISKRLSAPGNDSLSVSANYGWTPADPFPTPGGQYEFYCVLYFNSTDPSLTFEASLAASFTHLKKAEWEQACEPAYQAATANPNSPVTLESLSLTLIQGRMCDVTTMEVKKQ